MKALIKGMAMLLTCGFISSCEHQESVQTFCVENLELAKKQSELLGKEAIGELRIPRALRPTGEMHWCHKGFDWTQGFYPGLSWYFYEYTGNDQWKEKAETLQELFVDHRFYTKNHDLGFVFGSSYGNGYRLTGDERMKQIMIDAGDALMTRFNPEVGCIKSWDVDGGWQAKRGWEFPVIIDNMMNLELLFELTKLTGDSRYYQAAISHADVTMKNHFRKDGSSYHVVDFDPETGKVRNKHTAQGFAHESAWSRGQAWGLYGYTVCYRYTKEERYLNKAIEIAEYIINHENLPEDGVPFWDFDAPQNPVIHRDVSAAAITASALVELSKYSKSEYLTEAKRLLTNLSSNTYKSEYGQNNGFILKHSVGSIPHGAEIDVPIVYADYYYVEALIRLMDKEASLLAEN